MRPVHLALALVLVALPGCADGGRDQSQAPSGLAPNTSPAPLPAASAPTWEPQLIGTADLNVRINAGEKMHVYDVRHKEAWEKEHIKGAESLPWADIDKRAKALPKDAPLVLYCA